jgi:hypothetical protein
LTSQVQQLLVQALQAGASNADACDYAGIDEATFYRWLTRGAAGKSPYRELCEALTRARGQRVVHALAKISAAASDGDWRAAAWQLAVWRPDEYGKKMQLRGDPEAPLTLALDERLQQALAKVEQTRAHKDAPDHP